MPTAAKLLHPMALLQAPRTSHHAGFSFVYRFAHSRLLVQPRWLPVACISVLHFQARAREARAIIHVHGKWPRHGHQLHPEKAKDWALAHETLLSELVCQGCQLQ